MKRRFVWALPAIFAASAAVSAITADADVAALFTQIEGVLVTDAAQFVPAALLNQPEPVTVTDANQFTPAALLIDSEAVTVSDVESFPDTTPPVITVPATIVAEATSPTGAAVSFTATANDPDKGGVPVICTPVSGSTFPLGNTTVTCSASDPAGNTGTATFTITVLDTTAPAISASAIMTGDGKPYVAGTWTNQSVQVSFTCTDFASGVDPATVTAPVTLSAEGKDQSVIGSCKDKVGNSSSVSFHRIDIDKTPSTITYQGQSPAANGSSWNNSSVVLTWGCADALSGPVAASVSATIATEGSNQSATGTCSDLAGNTAQDTRAGINIDKTPPTITYQGQSPAANGHGWNNSTVVLTWSCADALSGPVATSVSATVATEGTNQSATGTCADLAGNTSQNTRTGVNIDKAPPVVTASAKTADGKAYVPGTWTSQNVTVTFTCTDDRSGVASVTSPITVSSEGTNQSASGDCIDNAGNAATRATFSGINIDQTPPVTGFTAQPGPLNGRQLVTVTAHVAVTPGAVAFDATCWDSFGVNAVLTANDNLGGATSIKYGFAPIVAGKPLPNPALDNTIAGSSGTIPFVTSGAYVLNYAAVDAAGNQEATQTRWLFVNTLLGVSCVTTPVPMSSLPRAGTVTVTGSLKIGKYTLPFAFSFTYPGRD